MALLPGELWAAAPRLDAERDGGSGLNCTSGGDVWSSVATPLIDSGEGPPPAPPRPRKGIDPGTGISIEKDRERAPTLMSENDRPGVMGKSRRSRSGCGSGRNAAVRLEMAGVLGRATSVAMGEVGTVGPARACRTMAIPGPIRLSTFAAIEVASLHPGRF